MERDTKIKHVYCSGSEGFIGTNLVRRLLKMGYKVTGIDNLLTSHYRQIKHKNYTFRKADISEPLGIIHEPFDYVFNLACPASPKQYMKFPFETIDANTNGISKILWIALADKSKVFHASTSEVYGNALVTPQTEDYNGNVITTGNRSCYTEDTEILTEDGWKFFSYLEQGDKVATLNNKTKQLEYHVPDEIIKQKYSGDVYTFENWNMSLSVTPNHKMLIKQRYNNDYILKEADSFSDFNHTSMLKQCKWEGKEQEYFYFPKETLQVSNYKVPLIEKVKMDDWIEFMGYYLTEGCIYFQKRRKVIKGKEYKSISYRIQISQSEKQNKEIFNKIKSCLDRLGIKNCVSRNGNCYFVFQNKQLAMYLKQFGKSADKFIPKEFLSLSKRQLSILYQAMVDGDGSKKNGKHISHKYYSKSKRLMDGFQEMLLKIGYFGNIIPPSKGGVVNHISCIESNKYHRYPKPRINPYKGSVYCVNVKNHIIYVRRSGKAVFCGNCYDEGKRIAETICYEYNKQFNVDIKIGRIFNTYGPFMEVDDGRVISNFINQALKNEDITIYGDGTQTRSFMYIDDLLDAMLLLIDYPTFSVMNIGNDEEITVKALAELIIKLTNSKSKITYHKIDKDDPYRRRPGITKIKKELNWQPKVKLIDGLKKTIEYYKSL